MPLLPPGCLVQLFQATKGFVCGSSLSTSDASRDLPAGANPNGEIWLNGAVKVWGTSTDCSCSSGVNLAQLLEIKSSLSYFLWFLNAFKKIPADGYLHSSLITSEPCLFTPDEHLVLLFQWPSPFQMVWKIKISQF